VGAVEVVCTGCGAKLSVAEDRLPATGAAQATCPKCKAKVTIARPAGKAPEAPAAYPPGWLERFEEGVRFALVLHDDDDTARLIGQALVELGYRISRAQTLEEAQARIKFNTYHVVVMQQGFGGGNGEGGPVLAFLNTLAMSQRRQMFVALLGAGLISADRMEAFVRSVNLTVAEADLPSLGKILKNSIAEHELFYKVFNETLQGLGR